MAIFAAPRIASRWLIPTLFVAFVVPVPAHAEETAACGASDVEHPTEPDRGQVQRLSKFTAMAGVSALMKKASEYVTKAKACTAATKDAQMFCTESCSASLKKANGEAAKAKITEMAANQAANDAAKALKIQEGGFKAFIAECGPRKTACETKCDEALKALDEMESLVGKLDCQPYQGNPAMLADCTATTSAVKTAIANVKNREKQTADFKSRAGKKNECSGKLGDNLAKAGVNLNSILGAIAQALAQALLNKSNSGTAQAAQAAPPVEALPPPPDPCTLDPRACSASTTQVTPVGASPGEAPPSRSSGTGDPAGDRVPVGGLPIGSGGSISGGDNGMPMMAGGGPVGGEGGETPPARAAASSGSGRTTTASSAIYGGDSGGGGGGYTDSYESGGDAKGTRLSRSGRGFVGGASEGYKSLGLTTSGGRSNWEKVRSRYYENSGSLLREGLASPAPAPATAKVPAPK